jgi:hypothetical protein
MFEAFGFSGASHTAETYLSYLRASHFGGRARCLNCFFALRHSYSIADLLPLGFSAGGSMRKNSPQLRTSYVGCRDTARTGVSVSAVDRFLDVMTRYFFTVVYFLLL